MANEKRLRPLDSSAKIFDGFPEGLYDLSDSSHIFKLMEAICGDGGVLSLQRQMFINRLQTSLDATRFYDLDRLYGVVLRFPRMSDESYPISEVTGKPVDPQNDMLTSSEWDKVNCRDASYRGRINKFLQALPCGGTLEGVRLAVSAATGSDCFVFPVEDFYKPREEADGSVPTFLFGVSSKRLGVADYKEVYAVVLADSLTAEQRRSAALTVSRLQPQDVIVSVVTSQEFISAFPEGFWGTMPNPDLTPPVDAPVASVAASSEFFKVKTIITGRSDWSLSLAESWVQPNETKEAPTLAMEMHQEAVIDNTPQIYSVTSSSNHVGTFGRKHAESFPYLSSMSGEQSSPHAALRRYGLKRVSSSFFGGRNNK